MIKIILNSTLELKRVLKKGSFWKVTGTINGWDCDLIRKDMFVIHQMVRSVFCLPKQELTHRPWTKAGRASSARVLITFAGKLSSGKGVLNCWKISWGAGWIFQKATGKPPMRDAIELWVAVWAHAELSREIVTWKPRKVILELVLRKPGGLTTELTRKLPIKLSRHSPLGCHLSFC